MTMGFHSRRESGSAWRRGLPGGSWLSWLLPTLLLAALIGIVVLIEQPTFLQWPGAIPGGSASSGALAGRPRVIDGDTISLAGQKIRLSGIDAPEHDQTCETPAGAEWACGRRAMQALSDRIGWSSVRCDASGHDRYGRLIGTCFQGNEDLNRWMVTNGWAVAYRQYSTDYVADEAAARRVRAGLWSGRFTMPSDWRKARREASAADGRASR